MAAFIEDPEIQDGQIQFSSCVNQKYAYGLEDIVLGALEKQGVDFWWIDWQRKSQTSVVALHNLLNFPSPPPTMSPVRYHGILDCFAMCT